MSGSKTLRYPAAAASPFASRRSSASGRANSAAPQSKQTTTSGNTITAGLSMFFSPRKWIPISAPNFLWLTDPHDLQGIPTPIGNEGIQLEPTPIVETYFLRSVGTTP